MMAMIEMVAYCLNLGRQMRAIGRSMTTATLRHPGRKTRSRNGETCKVDELKTFMMPVLGGSSGQREMIGSR